MIVLNSNILKRNNVRISGAGQQTLLFAHGFGCDQSVWDKIVPSFEANYRVVLFDYVGSGRSDKSSYDEERYGNLHGYAQDVINICDALDLKQVLYVGHSVSGMIGGLVAIKRPDLIDKLVMIGPSPHYLNEPHYNGGFDESDIQELLDMMETNYKEWTKYLAPVAMDTPDHPEMVEDFEELLYSNDPQIARQFAEATFYSDHRQDVHNILVKTLILQTTLDAIVPLEVAEFLHNEIPNSELVIMKKAKGHNPHISEPDETVAEIYRFIR